LSAALCAALSWCYAVRPDAGAAVTAWPVWVWVPLGLAIAALGWSRSTKLAFLVICLLWLLYVGIFAEEPRGLLRRRGLSEAEFRAAREDARGLRVVSLNCAGGSAKAAAEVHRHDPDIVLVQESPSEDAVRALAEELYGPDAAVAWGLDASIIARGRAEAVVHGLGPHIAVADVKLASGLNVCAISVRLSPPASRFDIWSAGHWREQASVRRLHREEMKAVALLLDTLPGDPAIILGGDFNAPAGDAAIGLLRPRLHDAFPQAGIGWGNTVLNDLPILRFDQVWASGHLRAAAVRTEETLHSDHRMVICDLVISTQ
jgi:endonuclease/exonuclease/phosphatase (EEP) superfamily protein YafD